MVQPVSQVSPPPPHISSSNTTTNSSDSPVSPGSTTSTPNPVVALFNDARKLINANADVYVERLAEAVAVQSVATDLTRRNACFEMADLLNRWIEELGGRCDKVLVGFQELDDGQRFDLPPVLMAEFRDPTTPSRNNSKPTVLVYGHYDVLPAERPDTPVVSSPTTPSNSNNSNNGNSNSNGVSTTNASATKDNNSDLDDVWHSNPFKLTERDGNLYARGVAADKGPVLAWLWAVEVFRELGAPLPVNLKFCLEGMSTSNSECLQDLLTREAASRGFLGDVDYAILPQSHWLTPDKPCLTYGTRGLASVQIEVRGSNNTLQSGPFAGAVHEPMTDLVQILAALSAGGHHDDVAVPGCERSACAPVTPDERELYRGLSFDTARFRDEAGGVVSLIGGSPSMPSSIGDAITKDQGGEGENDEGAELTQNGGQMNGHADEEETTTVLMNRWRFPALSIHGIEGAYSGSGMNTVIPGTVTGKLSIRLVPGQDVEAVEAGIRKVVEAKFADLESPNDLSVAVTTTAPWLTDPKSGLYQAGAAAILKVYGIKPDMTRDGGSINVVESMQRTLGVETMVLPMTGSDEAGVSENEKMGRRNYLMGVHVMFTVMSEIARVHAEREASGSRRQKRGAFGRLKDIWYGLS